jgi:hypothetical protein
MQSEIVAQVTEAKRKPRPTLYVEVGNSTGTSGQYYTTYTVPPHLHHLLQIEDIGGSFIVTIPRDLESAIRVLEGK